jgi:DNA polymerase II small subunit/DNA polymerase delta subunit B
MGNFEKIFRSLNKAKVRYLVVGGVAVNIYGYPRFTGDLDILNT